nr:glycoside hydrolase family 2 TIM barrel-domain containing protein [Jiangella alkaliphila]
MTSPSDAALVRDIELALAAGFNGARLHQKVFEERFYYHADRLGYLVWGEFGDWGVSGLGPDGDHQQPTASFLTQWLEVLERDRNHPSIVGWCPLNETHQVITDHITQLDDVTHGMYLATKLADPTRPVLDASGYSHRVPGADVYDSHDYEQDPQRFRRQQAGLAEGAPFTNTADGRPISVA